MISMSAEHGIIRAIDKLAFNGQPPTRDEDFELDGDEDSGDEAAPQGGSTNTSSKKKKKKKPKKKVSHVSYNWGKKLSKAEGSYESVTWQYTSRNTCTSARIGRR